jgi:hypothetical protein
MSDYVFFEYTAVIHLTRNPPASGLATHCVAKMRANDSEGNPISIEDLKTRAEDIISTDISLGPKRTLSDITFWQIDEERVKQLGDATDSKAYAGGTIYRYENFPEFPA